MTGDGSQQEAGRVVVDGDVVRRPAHPWTPTVHALLRHLRDSGLECVPEPLGIADGVETVSTLEGETTPAKTWRYQATDRGLRSAAWLLRDIHDASRGWLPPPEARWGIAPQPGAEVICHGDPGPWNMVWRDGKAVGIFDWDFAHPAPALHDVAYALEYFSPFRSDDEAIRWHGFSTPPDRHARLMTFAEAYGLEASLSPTDLVDAVIRQQAAGIEHVRSLAEEGIEPQRTWVTDGHLDALQTRVDWSQANKQSMLSASPEAQIASTEPTLS